MDDKVFTLFMEQFADIKAQNAKQLELLQDHIEIDTKAHKVVERHSAYFSVLGLGVTPIVGWIAYKLGFKH